MDDFQLFFACLGLSFLSYCIGRLINNAAILLEDTLYEDNIYSKFLVILSFFFYLVGLPVVLALHVIQAFPKQRMIDEAVQDEREKCKKYYEMEIRIAVRNEREKLYSEFAERLNSQPKK